jgi:hypothetical protein
LFLAVFVCAPAAAKTTFYVVACQHASAGATPEAALLQCRRDQRRMGGFDRRYCDCKARGDLLSISDTDKPAFYLTPFWPAHHSSPEAARAACEREERARKPEERDDCTKAVLPAYGPMKRKRNRAGYDDETVYRYLALGEYGGWVDENGEAPCFPAGTQVLTPDGERAIERIAPGDLVLSWSPERDGLVEARVVRAKQREARELFIVRLANGATLRATGNHPVYAASRAAWVPVDELRVGDELALVQGGKLGRAAVAAIAIEATPAAVFDLSVEPTHSYVAGGVWVHNY